MGNILNPSPGDLADRQTILEVKLAHCGVASDTGYAPSSQELMEQSNKKSVARTVIEKTEINIEPFLQEHAGIQERLTLDWFSKINDTTGAKFDALIAELKIVHERLFDVEDQSRTYLHAPAKDTLLVQRRLAELRNSTTTLNDKRALLIKQINALWELEIVEKLY